MFNLDLRLQCLKNYLNAKTLKKNYQDNSDTFVIAGDETTVTKAGDIPPCNHILQNIQYNQQTINIFFRFIADYVVFKSDNNRKPQITPRPVEHTENVPKGCSCAVGRTFALCASFRAGGAIHMICE
jgi:hypothetical protein